MWVLWEITWLLKNWCNFGIRCLVPLSKDKSYHKGFFSVTFWVNICDLRFRLLLHKLWVNFLLLNMHVKKIFIFYFSSKQPRAENMSTNKILLTFLNNSVFICFSDSKSEKKTTSSARLLDFSLFLQKKQMTNKFFKNVSQILTIFTKYSISISVQEATSSRKTCLRTCPHWYRFRWRCGRPRGHPRNPPQIGVLKCRRCRGGKTQQLNPIL